MRLNVILSSLRIIQPKVPLKYKLIVTLSSFLIPIHCCVNNDAIHKKALAWGDTTCASVLSRPEALVSLRSYSWPIPLLTATIFASLRLYLICGLCHVHMSTYHHYTFCNRSLGPLALFQLPSIKWSCSMCSNSQGYLNAVRDSIWNHSRPFVLGTAFVRRSSRVWRLTIFHCFILEWTPTLLLRRPSHSIFFTIHSLSFLYRFHHMLLVTSSSVLISNPSSSIMFLSSVLISLNIIQRIIWSNNNLWNRLWTGVTIVPHVPFGKCEWVGFNARNNISVI